MSDSAATPAPTQPDVEIARERTKQASIAGWTGGLSAFFAVGALATNPTWPVAVGVAAVAAMVAFICYGILKRQ
jgi:dipeptide/tripeptide permease